MRIRLCISVSLLALLVSYGCGGGSAEIEMQEARQAMDQARSQHADSLAPRDFQQAQKAWDHAQAAEMEGKTGAAKTLYASARIFFGKAADIAKDREDSLTRELSAMQLRIRSNFNQVKNDLLRDNLTPKQKDQVKAIIAEVEQDNASVDKLVTQEDFLKAVARAKDVQTKIYNAQLILAGKSPSKQIRSAQ
jgi:hypothetical protein